MGLPRIPDVGVGMIGRIGELQEAVNREWEAMTPEERSAAAIEQTAVHRGGRGGLLRR